MQISQFPPRDSEVGRRQESEMVVRTEKDAARCEHFLFELESGVQLSQVPDREGEVSHRLESVGVVSTEKLAARC